MADLIDRQVAIKEAYKIVIDGDAYEVVQVETLMGLPSVQPDDKCGECDAWNQYNNYPQQHWIPCNERLPEEGGNYLTTTMYQEVYCDYWTGNNFDRTEMVIAWMPLPEPYGGKENR